jgi:outer membrane protein assembly factor BamB
MSRRIFLACVMVVAVGSTVRAQVPFARDLLPTRTALARLGLERQWMAIVPVVGDERVIAISLSSNLLFAQTNHGNFHTFDAESGRHLWTNKLGPQTVQAQPASVNSFAVFVTNLNMLYALDRNTGRNIWTKELGVLPSSSTSCDEERVMVGLENGKLYGYGLKTKDKDSGRMILSDKPIDVWNWQTSGKIETHSVPAQRLVAFGSDDGKVYVALADEPRMLYRIATGGPIGNGLGTHGTRLLLIPSGDNNLYGVDLLTAQVHWVFPSGAPIKQEPLVSDNDIYVVNTKGFLSSIDPLSGSPRWTISTQGGPLMAVATNRIYLESHDGDLFIVDRATGQMIADPRSTYERAGLNVRAYDLFTTNRLNDRIYSGTSSGMLICLREIGQLTPRLLRKKKDLPFGYIPPEGVSLTPPKPTPAQPEAAPAAAGEEKPAEGKGAEPPAAGDMPAPAGEKPPK